MWSTAARSGPSSTDSGQLQVNSTFRCLMHRYFSSYVICRSVLSVVGGPQSRLLFVRLNTVPAGLFKCWQYRVLTFLSSSANWIGYFGGVMINCTIYSTTYLSRVQPYFNTWFQTFTVLWMLYSCFWVIPRRLNFMCRRFVTFYLFHLHRWCKEEEFLLLNSFFLHHLWRWNGQSVPKGRYIKFRLREVTQKKEYNPVFVLRRCAFQCGGATVRRARIVSLGLPYVCLFKSAAFKVIITFNLKSGYNQTLD